MAFLLIPLLDSFLVCLREAVCHTWQAACFSCQSEAALSQGLYSEMGHLIHDINGMGLQVVPPTTDISAGHPWLLC